MSLYTDEDLNYESDSVFALNGDYDTPPEGWSSKDWQDYLNWCKTEKTKALPSAYFRPDGEREKYLWCPQDLSNYEKAKFVMENGPAIVDGSLCDVFSASGMVQIFEALSEKNREKLNELGFAGAHEICFKLINKQR